MSTCFKILQAGDVIEQLTKISSFEANSKLSNETSNVLLIDSVSRQKASALTSEMEELNSQGVVITGIDYSLVTHELSLVKQSQQGYSEYHGDKAVLPDAALQNRVTSSLERVKQLWQNIGASYEVYDEIQFTDGDSFYPDGVYVSFEYGAYTGYQDMSQICEYSGGLKLGDTITLSMNGTLVSVSFLGEVIGQFMLSVVEGETDS